MKIKNKKTGEIKEAEPITIGGYRSLAELNEEWKDYEEPKWYWYINCFGKVLDTLYNGNEWDEQRKLIGNYFETKEQAELAVRKLKAWRRLKDKGFRFVRIDEHNEGNRVGQYIEFEMAYHFEPDAWQIGHDLDLLFGGEE